MTKHRYPRHSVISDYTRAAAGIVLTWGPFMAIPATSIAGIILGALGFLFVFFAGRTWIRSRTIIRLSDEGLSITTLQNKLMPWQGVTSLELRYFATKRDRSQGWMQLTLKDTDATIQIESTLEDFEVIARAAAHAASRKGLPLSPSTTENLRALDLPTDYLQARGRAGNEPG